MRRRRGEGAPSVGRTQEEHSNPNQFPPDGWTDDQDDEQDQEQQKAIQEDIELMMIVATYNK